MSFVMFEQNDTKTAIRFISTKDVYYLQWQRIVHKLNHLGYDFPDTDSCKEYFDRGLWLNPDQSQVVLEVFQFQDPKSTYPERQIRKANDDAMQTFGTTYNWSKAGFVLTNGRMLDFSGGQRTRTRDHREISAVINTHSAANLTPYQAMVLFINYGNIRTHENGFEVSCPPTPAQKEILTKYLWCKKEFFVEIVNYEGHTVYTKGYSPPILSIDVFGGLDDYFQALL